MNPNRMRGLISAVAVALVGSVALLAACADENQGPAGPEQPIAFSHSGDLKGGTADDTKTISDNISGDGSEVCNDSRVQDETKVGDDEGTWFGEKVDPPADLTNNGFTLDVSDDETHLFWKDDGKNLMQAVVIKAGGSSVVYYYNEGDPDSEPDPVADFSDTGLEGEGGKEISHYVYCFVEQPAVKSGLKLNDLDASGDSSAGDTALVGWEIRAYADDGDGTLSQDEFDAGALDTDVTADGDHERLDKGEYEFILEPGDYVICEVEQDGWNQSFPSGKGDCSAGSGLGDEGYGVTLEAAEVDDDNDFGNNQTTIEVTVVGKDEDGDGEPDPVKGHRVIGVNSQTGPYRVSNDPSSFISERTDPDGFAVLENLDPGGSYCVRAVPVTVTSDRLVPPLDATEAPDVANRNLGTALSKADPDDGVMSVPVNVENYQDACIDDPPLEPGDAVTLTLNDPANSVGGTFEITGSTSEEASAWYVADSSAFNNVPWLDDLPDPDVAGAVPALLQAASADDGTSDFDIPTDGPGTVESDKIESSDAPGAFLSASFTTGGSESGVTAAMEPLLCQLETVFEPDDDGGDPELKGDPVKYGFLADKGLEPLSPAGYSIAYRQTAGTAQLKFRAEVDGKTQRLNAEYVCDEDGCRITKERGKLTNDPDFELILTFSSDGDFGITWFLTGLPDGTEEGRWKVTSSDDAVPDPSRADTDKGLERAVLTETCENDQTTHQLGFD